LDGIGTLLRARLVTKARNRVVSRERDPEGGSPRSLVVVRVSA